MSPFAEIPRSSFCISVRATMIDSVYLMTSGSIYFKRYMIIRPTLALTALTNISSNTHSSRKCERRLQNTFPIAKSVEEPSQSIFYPGEVYNPYPTQACRYQSSTLTLSTVFPYPRNAHLLRQLFSLFSSLRLVTRAPQYGELT